MVVTGVLANCLTTTWNIAGYCINSTIGKIMLGFLVCVISVHIINRLCRR